MIVLASKSPRRKEILKDLGYDFIVCPAKKDEVFDLSLGLDEALKKYEDRFDSFPTIPLMLSRTDAEIIAIIQNSR
mgnify:CR=1 FL=1